MKMYHYRLRKPTAKHTNLLSEKGMALFSSVIGRFDSSNLQEIVYIASEEPLDLPSLVMMQKWVKDFIDAGIIKCYGRLNYEGRLVRRSCGVYRRLSPYRYSIKPGGYNYEYF